MEAQSAPAGGFTNAALNGGYIVGSRGDTTASSAGGVNSVGQFTADGKGNVTGGSFHTGGDGNPPPKPGVYFGGASSGFCRAAKRRADVTLDSGAPPLHP